MSDLDPEQRPELSVVAPMFNEAENIAPFVEAVVGAIGHEVHEIVLVDDGSSDETWEHIRLACNANKNVRGVRLSRNFGHQSAIFAGMSSAKGRAIVTMDGDLQHPPSVIPKLLAAWRGGSAIVHTERRDSDDTSAFKRLTSRWFYAIFSWLSGVRMRAGSSDFRLLDEKVLEVLLGMGDRDLFLRGIVNWLGFQTTTIKFVAARRHAGTTKFSLKRMLRFSVDGLISFSTLPLRVGTWIGFLTSLLAFAEISYIVVQYLRGITVPGWASVMTLMSLFFAILFLLIGMIGVYLARIYEILKQRPRHIISERVGFSAEPRT
jgi:polyisoprenyl-phosphate glycosyltransferase